MRYPAFDVNDFVPISFITEQPYAILASKRLAVKSFFLSHFGIIN